VSITVIYTVGTPSLPPSLPPSLEVEVVRLEEGGGEGGREAVLARARR